MTSVSLRMLLKWPTSGLVLVDAFIALAIVTRLWTGSEALAILETPAQAPKLPDPLIDPVPGEIDLASLQSMAVFYASRTFYVTPPAPQLQPPPDYRLSGVLVAPMHSPVAMLTQNQSGRRVRVSEGDTLDGWMVESIQSHSVRLRYAEQHTEIESVNQATASGLQRLPMQSAASSPSSAGHGFRILGSQLPPQR